MCHARDPFVSQSALPVFSLFNLPNTHHQPQREMALQSPSFMRSSLRTLVSSTPTASRPCLPHSLASVTRYASSLSETMASTSTAPSSSTTPLLPNQPPAVESALPTHQQPPRPPIKPARAAPRIKASKAALTLVRCDFHTIPRVTF
jgi:hypothetical protein